MDLGVCKPAAKRSGSGRSMSQDLLSNSDGMPAIEVLLSKTGQSVT